MECMEFRSEMYPEFCFVTTKTFMNISCEGGGAQAPLPEIISFFLSLAHAHALSLKFLSISRDPIG